MKIKMIVNVPFKGKTERFIHEEEFLINVPPQKKNTTELSNMVKRLFETELERPVVVKLRIKNKEVYAKVDVRANRIEE